MKQDFDSNELDSNFEADHQAVNADRHQQIKGIKSYSILSFCKKDNILRKWQEYRNR